MSLNRRVGDTRCRQPAARSGAPFQWTRADPKIAASVAEAPSPGAPGASYAELQGGDVKATGLRVVLAALIGLPSLLAVVLMASRVGDQARFVTWSVVAFTAVAGLVTVLGIWTGSRQPSTLAIGLLPAMVISYFLPAAPLLLVVIVLVAMAALTVAARGVACGIAAGTGTLMIAFVVLQGPAVECGESSFSGNSGPWWIDEPSQSTAYGTATAAGARASGTVQVGERHYSYECNNGRLASFERLAEDEVPALLPVPVPARPGDG